MNVAVVGGCTVDFICVAKGKTDEATSNAADIQVAPGGVGRNIAENLKNLGCDVTMVTSAGEDILAQYIERDLCGLGINAEIISKEKTGIYFALLKDSGIMDKAFCDMTNLESVTFEDIIACNVDFSLFDGVVIDANFLPEVITRLALYLNNLNIPYALEPVSNYKAPRIRQAIPGCMLIKPNRYEASVLTGRPCDTLEEARECAQALHFMGAKNILLSLGKEGFYFYHKDFQEYFLPETQSIVNETGAGDALLAAVFAGLLKGMGFRKAALIGRRAAAMTCQVERSVCQDITPAILKVEDLV